MRQMFNKHGSLTHVYQHSLKKASLLSNSENLQFLLHSSSSLWPKIQIISPFTVFLKYGQLEFFKASESISEFNISLKRFTKIMKRAWVKTKSRLKRPEGPPARTSSRSLAPEPQARGRLDFCGIILFPLLFWRFLCQRKCILELLEIWQWSNCRA